VAPLAHARVSLFVENSRIALPVGARICTAAPGRTARVLWCVIGPEGIEEHELASDLCATLWVGMHDHTQPAIVVVVLFGA